MDVIFTYSMWIDIGDRMRCDKVGAGMNNDIDPMLDRTTQNRCKGIVDDDGNTRSMRDVGSARQVEHITLGVADCFEEHGLGIGPDRLFEGA